MPEIIAFSPLLKAYAHPSHITSGQPLGCGIGIDRQTGFSGPGDDRACIVAADRSAVGRFPA
jgi:hypothetical protein